ncbi:MAG: hypothetical protein EOP04_07640 [Proteobacteria bacterium]|nr:MAG: hypothetical protein EOP04_07640 [Pseudomonadota bacterium]
MTLEAISYGRQKFIEAISILSGQEDIKTRVIAAFREIQPLESEHFVDPEDFRRFSNLRLKLASSEDFIKKGSLEEALAVSGIMSSLAAAVILK